jgi:mercuric ion transport protein
MCAGPARQRTDCQFPVHAFRQLSRGYSRYNQYASRMKAKPLLGIGLAGTFVAAVCCFTPVLVFLLAGVGLSALVGILDFVLFPALAVFVGLTIYALWKMQSETPN